ncbi:16S rRNA (adenine(1518)-N(6)/adenine(1519)-N(6))-dimethyltransferase RsmA [Mucisphaera calidilacus]|uniref:Ribosomal RNA small subunit methyltransferase A n=1 Tax=Mucisphaera calidilacus TaxID=2527982 RepID=A0A518BVX7_9BACT|nr:16S rRNA (adenine(1518)-N(6)/adenine(1519)-N(6))-dimethyltransferase RsmA [Mucisphaera calidilacus]QDU71136.1 Ribosomal RNA adenine dimethylase [Mucisphaera calidilacus]
MTPDEPSVQRLLAMSGLHPKKALGQNFLIDRHHLQRIVEAAELSRGDRVVEVGPGTGVLTACLLEAGVSVVAVEFDRDLEPLLRERFGEDGERFRLIIGDALDGKHGLNPGLLEAVGDQAFSMVANLPYQIASPLLINLAIQTPGMRRAVVMIQREVADRIAAGPGSKTYGVLSILLQAAFEVEKISRVPPGCFYPSPKIDSAVIRLRRLAEPRVGDLEGFGCFLHRLFSQRRKQVGSVLGRDLAWPDGLTPESRPEQIGIDDLVRLYKVVLDQGNKRG